MTGAARQAAAPTPRCCRGRPAVIREHSFAVRASHGMRTLLGAGERLRRLLRRLGFDKRIRGDHYIFTKEGVVEILNP